MRVVIVAAGPTEDIPSLKPFLDEKTVIIAVDGGVTELAQQGLAFDLAIGDFDSLGYKPEGAIIHPAEKDETDLELALRHVSQQYEATEVFIFGATGGRLDMTLQNVYLLKQFPAVRLMTKREEVRFLQPGTYEIEADGFHYLSFIPLVPTRLTLRGVKYPLTNHDVPVGGSLTVSNEWTQHGVANVTVHTGEVIALRSLSDR